LSWVIFDIILNNFYWRNTKESVKNDEYNLPPYTEDVQLCDFNEVEKSLYDDCLDNMGMLAGWVAGLVGVCKFFIVFYFILLLYIFILLFCFGFLWCWFWL
jgi:hypothetical protein